MKLFASDYDGTLHLNGEVSQDTLNMIHTFRSQGNLFGIATGRSIGSIVSEIEKYGVPVDFLVGNNGSIVMNQHREELFYQLMDFEICMEIVNSIPQDKVAFYGISDGYKFGLHDATYTQDFVDQLIDIKDIIKEKTAVGIFVKFNQEGLSHYYADLWNQKYHGIIKAYPFYDGIDVVSYGITKKSGLFHINDYYEFDGPIYTIGDSFNDIPMIKGFNGFAMCSGEDAVKEVASQCFETVADALRFVMNQDEVKS
jgi:HAD superfamily hydrolase (TIGR01484 family)